MANTPMALMELTGAEYITRHAQLTNALGVGRAASMRELQRVTWMGRAGLGDFQTLLGNVTDIQRVTGGAGTTTGIQRLENVMSQAVAAGFDKSRVAQSFFRTTSELSRSLGLTRLGGMAQYLGFTARTMAVGDRPDERALAEAARGITAYGEYTRQVGGVMGAAKLQGIFGAGVDFAGGAGTLARLSAPEISDFLAQLGTGDITSPKLQDLVREHGIEGTRRVLRTTRRAATALPRGLFNLIMGRDANFQKNIENVRNAGNDATRRRDALLEFRKNLRFAGDVLQIGGEGLIAMGTEYLTELGIPEKTAKDALSGQIERSKVIFRDPAQVNLRRYIDGLVSDFARGQKGGVGLTEYQKYLVQGGAALRIGEFESEEAQQKYGAFAGQVMDTASIAAAQKAAGGTGKEAAAAKAYLEQAERSLGNISRLDLARGASYAAEVRTEDQRVWVSNMFELAQYIRMLNPRNDLNR
jgi:hypothetical protein